MASKATDNWTSGELVDYNVHFVDVPASAFLNTPDVTATPLPGVPATILEDARAPTSGAASSSSTGTSSRLHRDARYFFQYLKLVERKEQAYGSRVLDFAAFLLRMLRFDEDDDHGRGRGAGQTQRVICREAETVFPMAKVAATPAYMDLCIMDDLDILLIVYECRSSFLSDDPEPRIVGQAIAAFFQSNDRRRRLGLPLLPGKYVPVIVMHGSAPIFYRVPVTPYLVECVRTASYPQEKVVVQRFTPPTTSSGDVSKYKEEGMSEVGNRRIILQCLEAFRKVVL